MLKLGRGRAAKTYKRPDFESRPTYQRGSEAETHLVNGSSGATYMKLKAC